MDSLIVPPKASPPSRVVKLIITHVRQKIDYSVNPKPMHSNNHLK